MQLPPSRTYTCATCGSDQVMLDAWAAWSAESQSWELAATMQSAFCEECDGETRLIEQPLPDTPPETSDPRPTSPANPEETTVYEIVVDDTAVHHRSPDPAAALYNLGIILQNHRDNDPSARIAIQRRSGDSVEPVTFPELLGAAVRTLHNR